MRAPLLSRSHRRRRRGVDYPIVIEFDGDEPRFFEGGWSEVGGNILNDQISLGVELVTNGDFANWTLDNPDNWTVTGEVGADPEVSEVGSGQGHGGAGSGLANFFSSATANQPKIEQVTTTPGMWVQTTFDVDKRVAGSIRINYGTGFTLTYNSEGSKIYVGRTRIVRLEFNQVDAGGDITIDNVSSKQFVLTSLLNSIKPQFGIADGFFIDVYINAVTSFTPVGVIWNLDDAATPANFGMAYMDGERLKVDKNVAGTYTSLASVVQAVTQDQILRIENPAGSNVLDILYNGVSKATPTIADASVIVNPGIALFSTEANNAISKVVIGKL